MSALPLRRVRLTCLWIVGLAGAALAAQSGGPVADPDAEGSAVAQHRQRQPGRPHLGHRRAGERLDARHRRIGVGRRLEVGQRRHDLDDDLRQLRRRVDRRRARSTRRTRTSSGSAPAKSAPRNSAAWGDGIYKSTDGGKTFQNMGLKDTYNIARILLHPDQPGHRLRGGAGQHLGHRSAAAASTRRSTAARRGPSSTAGLPNGADDRRDRAGDGSGEPGDSLRRRSGSASAIRGRSRAAATIRAFRSARHRRRRERRHLQDDRRRQDVEAADERAARWQLGRIGLAISRSIRRR